MNSMISLCSTKAHPYWRPFRFSVHPDSYSFCKYSLKSSKFVNSVRQFTSKSVSSHPKTTLICWWSDMDQTLETCQCYRWLGITGSGRVRSKIAFLIAFINDKWVSPFIYYVYFGSRQLFRKVLTTYVVTSAFHVRCCPFASQQWLK